MLEKLGRNDLCPCGSGRKFKKCCLRRRRIRRCTQRSLLSGIENIAAGQTLAPALYHSPEVPLRPPKSPLNAIAVIFKRADSEISAESKQRAPHRHLAWPAGDPPRRFALRNNRLTAPMRGLTIASYDEQSPSIMLIRPGRDLCAEPSSAAAELRSEEHAAGNACRRYVRHARRLVRVAYRIRYFCQSAGRR